MATKVLQFIGSDSLGTTGAEVEAYIVDCHGCLHPAFTSPRILYLQDPKLNAVLTPEFLVWQIEAKYKTPATTAAELQKIIYELFAQLRMATSGIGAKVLPVGRHPMDQQFSHLLTSVYPEQRYHELVGRIGPDVWAARHAAYHSHFGLLGDDMETNIRLHNLLAQYLGIFACIGLNSPDFRNGMFYGAHSRRLQRIPDIVRFSTPPIFDGAEDWMRHVEDLYSKGLISRITELWYWLRFNAQTLEIRVADMPLNPEMCLAISGLFTVMCHWGLELIKLDLDRDLIKLSQEEIEQDIQRAAFQGFTPDYAQRLFAILNRLNPIAVELGWEPQWEFLKRLVAGDEKTGAQIQIDLYRKFDGNLSELTMALVEMCNP